MPEVVIAGAARTPIGSFNGALSSLPAHRLGGVGIVEAMRRSKVEAQEVSEVIMGEILGAGEGKIHKSKLEDVNKVFADLKAGTVNGRAVLVM